jgi:hypothetical protein
MTEDEASEPLTGRVGPLVNVAEGAVREIAKAGTGREITELPALLQNLPEKDHWQDIRLKRIYALTLLIALGIQVAIADGVLWRTRGRGPTGSLRLRSSTSGLVRLSSR